MADFKTPNLCGANPELNNALSKLDDLKNDIASKLDSTASEAAAAFETGLADVKAGLDGLAIDLPEIPPINFQSELTGLINDIDRTTIQGIAAFNAKLATLELDFGDTLKEKGLTLDSLITESTTKLSGGGNICDLVPNIDIPAGNSGTGITIEEVEERGTGTSVTLTQIPKEIISVQGKKTGVSFFGNIQYTQNGKVIVPKETGTYSEIKVKYTVSLIKEKPVEAKQADTSPEPEEVSIITTNVLSVENKTTFKFSSLIKKLDNLSGGQIDTTKINSDISSALSAIKSPEFKAKMQADLDYAAAERKKLFADPLNYKKVVVPSGSVGEPAKTVEVTTPEVQNTVKVETVTKTNPVTKQEETVTVKKTEKSTISINGIAMRKVVLKERFHTKDAPEKFSKMKGSTLVDDMSKLTLKKFPIRVLSVRGRPYYGENRESRGFKYYAYDNPSEYGGDDYGVKTFRKPSTLIELSQQTYDDGEKQANPANMTVMLVKYFVYEKLDPNFKG
tara:strand:- start:40 stop:1557 length:1518 start_codon:yes stop_codon:yes gene_type:complete